MPLALDDAHAPLYTVGQVAVSDWLGLPALVHGADLGTWVASWSAHGVAIEGSAAVVLAVPQAYAFAGTTVRVLTGANVSRALLEG